MDLGKIFSIINDQNIDKNEVFKLVDIVKNTDLNDERNLRSIIQQAGKIARKNISPDLENQLVKKIQAEGFTGSLLDLL